MLQSASRSLILFCLLTWQLVNGQQQWPVHNDRLNTVVEWDHYSFSVNGERIYVWSGEMHYWRIPVPEVWIDILQKIKAAGFNTVSFYANWEYHNAKDGVIDFENGVHNFSPILTLARDVGLYVIFRPGPYVNAEASAGALPGWVTTGAYGSTRNNDTRYTKAWTPYFDKMSQTVAEHQVTNGGPVIVYQVENEYGEQFLDPDKKTPNETAIAYMELLEKTARDNNINVPLIANNPNMWTRSWSPDYSNVGGNVDIYGLDHYPSCWTCDLSQCTAVNGVEPPYTVFDYYTNFQEVAPTQPSFLTEFQGGSFNPWGGPQGGCTNNTGPDFVNLFYRHNIAQKVNAMNIYMLFGGTNWGGIPAPVVATSYDYSAPISESRLIGEKYYETKLFGHFLRIARGLTKVDRLGNNSAYATNPAAYATELRNPDTNGAFYVTRHANSTIATSIAFRLHVSTSIGNLTVPQFGGSIQLDGHESKILVTDFPIGSYRLVYSTAELLTVSTLAGRTTAVFWVPTGESGEFLLHGAQSGLMKRCEGCSNVNFRRASHGLAVSFTQSTGMSVLELDNGFQAVIVDRDSGYRFWAPTLSTDPQAPDNQTVLVYGPYLVRNVKLDGASVQISGDVTSATAIEIFVPLSVKKVRFNGEPLHVTRTSYNSVVGRISASKYSVDLIVSQLPTLDKWKVHTGLPERAANYDDSNWIHANHSSTPNPQKPDTYPVLFSDEYGFHHQTLLWRGRFTGNATAVWLDVYGGNAVGWSAFLNGDFVGSWLGDAALENGALAISFHNATVKPHGENVLLVIQDHMGKDETTGALNPRGIMNATLIRSVSETPLNFSSWKVAGTAGGENNIDPVRGPFNEGGLHSERLGWHLPGFDDADWRNGSPNHGTREAGVTFYRAVVPLNVPAGIDVSMGFELTAPAGSKLRAQLYVNGYMFGKFVPWIGNQIIFPVFPGILNYRSNNTIGLSLWAQDAAGARMSVKWTVLGLSKSAFDPSFDATYLQPGWTDRSMYY